MEGVLGGTDQLKVVVEDLKFGNCAGCTFSGRNLAAKPQWLCAITAEALAQNPALYESLEKRCYKVAVTVPGMGYRRRGIEDRVTLSWRHLG